jgi:glycosyltransferase involved in cell wall biosynthesis
MSDTIKQISVLMPTYNCAKYIRASVKSVLNQTFREFELIIVDDGSTDNTEEVISAFKDSRIDYRKIENRGTSAALNYGLSLCSSQWVARIDADDLNVPKRLEKQVLFLEANPEYDAVSSWSVYFRDPNKILFSLQSPVEHDDIYNSLDLHNPLNQSAMIYRKEKIITAGYNEEFRAHEDFELFHRLRDSVRYYNIPEYLAYIRVREESKTYSEGKENVYNFLINYSFKKMIESESKGIHFYWAGNIAWINFFFGNKNDARSFFKSSKSLKNSVAYLTTLLPQRYFNKLIDLRIKYRLKSFFSRKQEYKQELVELLK